MRNKLNQRGTGRGVLRETQARKDELKGTKQERVKNREWTLVRDPLCVFLVFPRPRDLLKMVTVSASAPTSTASSPSLTETDFFSVPFSEHHHIP